MQINFRIWSSRINQCTFTFPHPQFHNPKSYKYETFKNSFDSKTWANWNLFVGKTWSELKGVCIPIVYIFTFWGRNNNVSLLHWCCLSSPLRGISYVLNFFLMTENFGISKHIWPQRDCGSVSVFIIFPWAPAVSLLFWWLQTPKWKRKEMLRRKTKQI